MSSQLQHVQEIIDSESNGNLNFEVILLELLKAYDCTTGSIHILNPETNTLHLKAQKGIPPFLLPKMTIIPVGKGMAGIAAERLEPVQMCNLQTDESGIARPSAKDTKVEGALTIPMICDDKLFGTIGIAKSVPYDFTDNEISILMKIGTEISQKL